MSKSILDKYNLPFDTTFLESINLVDSSLDVEPNDIVFIKTDNQKKITEYINESINKRASYVITSSEVNRNEINDQIINTDKIDNLMRDMVSVRYPSYNRKNLYGITGTNGKTTSCHFTKILIGDETTEFIGTTRSEEIEQVTQMPSLTTPTFIPISKYIENNKQKDNFILEVSSHALAQDRLNDLKFKICSFTNLSQDHLDFHLSMDDYFKAKQSLFNSARTNLAIIFSNDWGIKLAKSLNIDYVTVGFNSKDFSSFQVTNQEAHTTEGNLTIDGNRYDLQIPLSGPGMLENFLVAITNAYFSNQSFSYTLENIQNLTYPEGRYQCIKDGTKNIIVDYAHTPKALESLLSFSKQHYKRVTVVFGCGGNRDTTKRQLMGTSSQIADSIILTSDNPRDENPESIIEAILKGIENKKSVSVIVNRREAIEKAIREAEEEEAVIIAGRGHESFQEVAGDYIKFKDSEVVSEILN